MTTKHLFLSMALCASLNLANASSSSGSSANNSPSFEYETQVFKRYAASNLDESLPSLAQLYQDAKARKTHLDSLFTYLDTHKTTEPTLNLFHGIISYSQYLRQRHCPTQEVPQDIHVLSFFKNDYAVERDLMTYFVNALEHMATTPPTQARIEELYAQTVQTTRLNLQSLSNSIFDALSRRHPLVFQHEVIFGDHMKTTDDVLLENIKDSFSEEERAFFKFTKELGSGRIDMFEVDTVEITRHLRDLFKIKNITFDDVCFDLNSLSFYLNLERALLAASSSLRFEPHKFGFNKGATTLKDRFILSALQDYHQKGLLSNMGARVFNSTELALLKRSKDKLLVLMLKDEATQAIDTMLAKLGAERSGVTVGDAPSGEKSKKTLAKKSKASSKKNATKKKGKTKATKSNGALSQTKKADTVKGPESNSLLLAKEEWDVDESVASPLNTEPAEAPSPDEDEGIHTGASAPRSYLSALASSASQSSTHVARQIPHLDDYLFKRNVAWTPHINRAAYTFNGQRFEMEGTFFPREQLLRVKELTGHKPGQAKLPNLASAHLRFHYTVGGIDKSYDFVPQARYLSGGFRFAPHETYRTNAHIQNAYHNVMSHADKRAFLKDDPTTRHHRISRAATQGLETHVAKGPWAINAADSEGILLLDVTKDLPRYLAQLVALEGGPLHIRGAVLGVSTYRDPCWRCRNLLQGWQWGLENALTVAGQENALPITVEKGLPTLVFGFGEIKPDSHDFFPPRMSQEEAVLSPAGESDYASNTHKLRLVAMQR